MDRRLRLAIGLALIGHWPLVAAGRYRLSYDAYVHMFLADHYRRDWWALWDPRWYTGFTVVSYPPLVHQLIAALAPLAGIEAAWAAVLLGVLVALPSGVYAFARIFVARRVAGDAAIASAVLPSIYLAAYTFGQLPTLAGLLVVLWGLAVMARYLRDGRPLDGALAVMLMAVIAAAHHGTLLFLPWGVATVSAHQALTGRVARRRLLVRLAVFSLASIAAVLIVIWPFWQWGLGQTMQTPIDHLSRHNFILDPAASLMFFWPVYGPLVFLMPWAVRAAFRKKRIALGVLFAMMFVLGLGGTTPLPRWLYGEQWAWLTYDRFALWASVALLPFAGLAVLVVQRRLRRLDNRVRLMVRVIAFVAMGASSVAAVMVTTIRPTQPRPVDMRPIVTFLAQDDRSQWRYLTFGFGDQMARLSLLTDATTIDGSYHTARQLPELRTSGIGQIDAAYWSSLGVDGLDPILDRASTHGVRWGFVNLSAYSPVLIRHGWRYLATLTNGVEVWENPSAGPPRDDPPASAAEPLTSISWGVLPLAALAMTSTLAWLRTRRRND
jgi:uncharacterized membrane protein